MNKLRLPYPEISNRYGLEELAAIIETLQSDTLATGVGTPPQIDAFQKEFAEFIGVKHAFAVCNCTAALELAGELIGIGPSDEIIVPAITFISTALAVSRVGGKPVFADIDPRTLNLTRETIEAALTARTKAIYVVHFSGLPADMDPIMNLARQHDLAVVEDCAHAPRSHYKDRYVGSIGDFGCFSFHTVKNMTTLGEGGMITTNNDQDAYDIPRLRWVGTTLYEQQERYWLPFLYDVQRVRGVVPHNFNMSEVQAAVGRVQLRKVDQLNQQRRAIAHKLSARLKDIDCLTVPYEPEGGEHVYHLYQLLFDGSEFGATVDDFIAMAYNDFGVQIVPHYLPIYRFSMYRDGEEDWAARCPVAEEVYRQMATMSASCLLTDEDIEYVVEAVTKTVNKLEG